MQDLRVDTFLTYQQLSKWHCYGKHGDTVWDSCWSFLSTNVARDLLQNILVEYEDIFPIEILHEIPAKDEDSLPLGFNKFSS